MQTTKKIWNGELLDGNHYTGPMFFNKILLTVVWCCHRCETLSENAYQEDTLILAGDISDDQAILRSTFELMVRKFEHVFFVPGNHDLWVRRKERGVLDSLGAVASCPP